MTINVSDGIRPEASASNSEAAKAAAEQLQQANDRLKAIRVIAAAVSDSTEARRLFAMLGLGAEEIRAAAQSRTVAA